NAVTTGGGNGSGNITMVAGGHMGIRGEIDTRSNYVAGNALVATFAGGINFVSGGSYAHLNSVFGKGGVMDFIVDISSSTQLDFVNNQGLTFTALCCSGDYTVHMGSTQGSGGDFRLNVLSGIEGSLNGQSSGSTIETTGAQAAGNISLYSMGAM